MINSETCSVSVLDSKFTYIDEDYVNYGIYRWFITDKILRSKFHSKVRCLTGKLSCTFQQ